MINEFFDLREFDSPDNPGSGKNMQVEFITRLSEARRLAGVPFKINSGFRTQARNMLVGGSPGSSHLGGWASDIACRDGLSRQKILTALIQAGFKRIGIAATFIHADCDPSKKPSIWLY